MKSICVFSNSCVPSAIWCLSSISLRCVDCLCNARLLLSVGLLSYVCLLYFYTMPPVCISPVCLVSLYQLSMLSVCGPANSILSVLFLSTAYLSNCKKILKIHYHYHSINLVFNTYLYSSIWSCNTTYVT